MKQATDAASVSPKDPSIKPASAEKKSRPEKKQPEQKKASDKPEKAAKTKEAPTPEKKVEKPDTAVKVTATRDSKGIYTLGGSGDGEATPPAVKKTEKASASSPGE